MKFFWLRRSISILLRLPQRSLRRQQLLSICALFGFVVGWGLHQGLLSQGWGKGIATAAVPSNISEAQAQTPAHLGQQGKNAYSLGNYAQAVQFWQSAALGYEQQGDAAGQARCLSNLSLAHQAMGHWPEAEAAIAHSLSLANRLSPQLMAQALNTQGELYLATGQAEAALDSWQQAQTAYAQVADQRGLMRSQLNQVQALRMLGFYHRALVLMERLQPDIQAMPTGQLKAIALAHSGELQRLAGDQTVAEQQLNQALGILEEQGLQAEQAQVLMNLAALAHTDQQPERALDSYNRALLLATDRMKPQIQLAKLSLLIQQSRYSEALLLWPQIEATLAKLPVSHHSSYQRITLASQLIKFQTLESSTLESSDRAGSPSWQLIEQLLQTTLAQAQQMKDIRAESYALGILARSYYKQKRLPEAEQAAQQALVLAESLAADEMAYRWQWILSQIQRDQGQLELAIANCGESVERLQGLQDDLVALNSDVLFSFRTDIEPVYRGYVDMLLQADSLEQNGSQSNQQNLRQVQNINQRYLTQAQVAARSLRLSEMTNFLGENCGPIDPLQSAELGEVDPHAAIVHPIVLPDRLEIVVNFPDGSLKHFPTSIPQAELEQQVRRFRRSLVVRSRRSYLRPAQQLYDWLVRPMETELEAQTVETLVFSLDGLLQGIPMAALHDGEQFLVESYQIALSPSPELFEPRPLNHDNLSALAVGLSQPRHGFSALPFVTEEIEDIQRRIDTTKLLDQAFTKEALSEAIAQSQSPIVHIATHGQFGSRPEETFLLAWDEAVNVNQLDRLLEQRNDPAQKSSQAIELLVLSACETATGDQQALLGLAGLAIKAGARSTLATLWSVNDAGTSVLMDEFYQALAQPNRSRARALQQAQQSLLNDPSYRHPLYWASYVMVGNWL